MITPSEYLKEYSTNQMAMPCPSSWGYKGFSEFWLESSNDWIYPYLHEAGRLMKGLAQKDSDLIKGDFRKNLSKSALRYRALNQAARELLLAESSDWPFIMKAGTMVAYAQKRLKAHLNRFYKLFKFVSFIYPNFYSNFSISALGFILCVVNVGSNCVSWHSSGSQPFTPCNFDSI